MKRSMLTITSAVCAAGLIAIIVGSHNLCQRRTNTRTRGIRISHRPFTIRTHLGSSPPIWNRRLLGSCGRSMSSKVELSKGGTPYRCRHDWRFALARIRLSLKIPELNQSKHSASLCFSTRTSRPAEIKRARLATCRMPVGADRSRQ